MNTRLDMNTIPNEMVYKILSYLTLKEKMAVERVSKKWSSMLRSLYLTHHSLHIHNGWCLRSAISCAFPKHRKRLGDLVHNERQKLWFEPKVIQKHIIESIVDRCANLTALYFGNIHLSVDEFLWAMNCCPNMICLSFIEVNHLRPEEWEYIFKTLGKRLKHLTISDCNGIPPQALLPVIPSLEDLSLNYYSHPLSNLLSVLGPNIHSLSLRGCKESEIEAIEALIEGNGRHLTKLSIDTATENRHQCFRLICKHMKNLKHLLFGFSIESLQPLLGLKNLRRLEMSPGLQWLTDIGSLYLTNVNHLFLNGRFSPEEVMGIESMFPNLEILKFYYRCKCLFHPLGPIRDPFAKCNKCLSVCLQMTAKMKCLKSLTLNGDVIPLMPKSLNSL